jgi:hypothetical protein
MRTKPSSTLLARLLKVSSAYHRVTLRRNLRSPRHERSIRLMEKQSEKDPMTDHQLAKELHELKRRRETPLPLIEMFDALLSLAPGLSAKQKRKRSEEIMATALKRLERKDA